MSDLLELDYFDMFEPDQPARVVDLAPLTLADVAEALYEADGAMPILRLEELAGRAGTDLAGLRREMPAHGLVWCPNCSSFHDLSKDEAKAVRA